MKTHNLKTVNPYFEEVLQGKKTFECRKNDREFESGDRVILNEYDAKTFTYLGRNLYFEIGYILNDYPGLQPDYVVFSLIKVDDL